MTGSVWTAEELDRIGGAEELRIAVRRPDGSLRRPVPIWVVRVGEELFIRSWRGANGSWYRNARLTHDARISSGGLEKDVSLAEVGDHMSPAVDTAYRAKYGRYSGYVEPMVAPQARATMLKVMVETSPAQP